MSVLRGSIPLQFLGFFAAYAAGVVLSAVGSGIGLGHAGVALVFGPVLLYMVALFRPSSTHVGADGVVHRWLGRTRFIPHSEITGVEANSASWWFGLPSSVILTMRTGGSYRIAAHSPYTDGKRTTELAERVEKGRRAAERGRVSPNPQLRRNDRPSAEWVGALRAITQADFRTAGVSRAHLFDVIADGTASAVERVAAMIARGPTTTDEELERLDRIAEGFAAPDLSLALDVGPAADHATLVQLLEDVERGALDRIDPRQAREGRGQGLEPADEFEAEQENVPGEHVEQENGEQSDVIDPIRVRRTDSANKAPRASANKAPKVSANKAPVREERTVEQRGKRFAKQRDRGEDRPRAVSDVAEELETEVTRTRDRERNA